VQRALGFDSVAATMGSSAVTSIQRGKGEEELDLGLSKEKEKQLQAFADGLETWDLNPGDIQLGKELGRGAYGTVFSATLRGQNVAVKKLNSQNIDEKKLADFKKEVEIMSKLRHPNVLLFMGACTQPGNLMIVTELMPKGSLRDLLKDSKYTFKQRMQFAKQTAQGMAWLHTMTPPMIHRDLK
jgi:sterile alpha motif and leucine zipper-containing kinase AZK